MDKPKSELLSIEMYEPQSLEELQMYFNFLYEKWKTNRLLEERFVVILEIRKRFDDEDETEN